jgi:hypothetical protein
MGPINENPARHGVAAGSEAFSASRWNNSENRHPRETGGPPQKESAPGWETGRAKGNDGRLESSGAKNTPPDSWAQGACRGLLREFTNEALAGVIASAAAGQDLFAEGDDSTAMGAIHSIALNPRAAANAAKEIGALKAEGRS